MQLRQLSEAVGVSGKEGAVRKIVLEAIKDHVTDIRIDALGSITAVKKGSGKTSLRVMLAAHMDEIGLMITGYESSGLLRFTNVGGIDERILPGLRVKIGDKPIPGTILWAPIHKTQGQENTVKIKDLRIDIGASNKDEASGKVKLGDRVAFDSRYMEIGDQMLRGKAFDDRVGCSLLIDVLQGGPYPVDVLAAFTVQEEIGLRGARVAAQMFNPDVAFALEGTTANDFPNPLANPDDDLEPNPVCRLGAGPVLTAMDSSLITDPRILGFLRKTAQDNNIPYQLKTLPGGGTDAGAIHLANAGVPSGVVSMPCRYIHSPQAYLRRDDYTNTLRLIQAVLNNITPATLARN
jgi:endoglucanase